MTSVVGANSGSGWGDFLSGCLYVLTTDADGRFTLPTMDFLEAFVQIKVADGKDFATVNLPIKMFETGELAVVLQPRQ